MRCAIALLVFFEIGLTGCRSETSEPAPDQPNDSPTPDDGNHGDAEGPAHVSGDDGGADSASTHADAGPGSETTGAEDFVSGSRLRARYYKSPTGLKQFIEWYDTTLKAACNFERNIDGVFRCLPGSNQSYRIGARFRTPIGSPMPHARSRYDSTLRTSPSRR